MAPLFVNKIKVFLSRVSNKVSNYYFFERFLFGNQLTIKT